MPAKKTTGITKAAPKKAAAKKPPAKKVVKATTPKRVTAIPIRRKTKSVYIDSSFFFPYNGGGYADYLQDGRVALTGQVLIAPIVLPVGSIMKTVTIYYKNNTQEEMAVWILKHHIEHHAYSGEVEVTYEGCTGGTNPPDNFLQKEIDHFDAGGKILDKYFYHIEVGDTVKNAKEERILRAVKIVYTEPL